MDDAWRSGRRLALLIAASLAIASAAGTGCGEAVDGPGETAEGGTISGIRAHLSPSKRRQRARRIRDAACNEGMTKGWLLAGIASSETNFAHCWSEATWACKGPASPDCGGGPVIAGSADGPCSHKQGGLGLFQFDAGTYSQTLQREGRKILTVAGSTEAAIDFVTSMVVRSRYVAGVSNRQQAIQWMNGVRLGTNRFGNWIKTVTHYYNGCKPSYGCWSSRFARYKKHTRDIYREMGSSFWKKCSGGGGGHDASMTVRVDGASKKIEAGSSKGVVDTFAGERFTAVIRLKNKSSTIWQGPRIGYRIEAPYLKPVDYRIESDHPHHDQKSWSINSADSNPKNPAKSKLGKKGRLHMDAFSPGESKRVVIELRAGRYSIGYHDHPDVRGWLWHIDGIYGEADSYFAKPTNANPFGQRIRDHVQHDVFDRDGWLFRGSHAKDREGWRGRGPHDALEVEQNDNQLRLKATGPDAGLVSPGWTRVDAGRFDELVLRLRSRNGPHTVAVYFKGADQSFSEDRVVRFEAPGDGAFHRLVVPVAEHPKWEGTVEQIRVDPWDDKPGVVSGTANGAWFDVSQVYFQDSAGRKTSTWSKDYSGRTRVQLERNEQGGTDGGGSASGGSGSATAGSSGTTGTGSGGSGSTTAGTGGLGAPPERPGGGRPPGGSGTGSSGASDGNTKSVTTSSGCSAAGSGGPPGLVVVGLFVIAGLARRRGKRPATSCRG